MKKLDVKNEIVEQDEPAKTKEVPSDYFNTLMADSLTEDEFYTRLKVRVKKHFNEKGENIHLKK